ncbi:MAG: SH3 domain-containing protein [Alphaproteobacteria bacterium]|nr:SH3 domain-containing protein [Alphaproteobacteria bacterium]
MRFEFVFISALLMLCFLSLPVAGQSTKQPPAFHTSALPLPRWASLGADEVFVRAGPGMRYPILWTLRRQGLPVEIFLEFEGWRKIKDPDGQVGWVHQSLLSGQRMGIIKAEGSVHLRQRPDSQAAPVAVAERGAQVKVEECGAGWCEIQAADQTGWVESSALWGVYAQEKFD